MNQTGFLLTIMLTSAQIFLQNSAPLDRRAFTEYLIILVILTHIHITLRTAVTLYTTAQQTFFHCMISPPTAAFCENSDTDRATSQSRTLSEFMR